MQSKVLVCLCVLVLTSTLSFGQSPGAALHTSTQVSPVGRWKTVDDATGKVKSVVVIWEENTKLYGRIVELVDPDPRDPDPRCNLCEGELKGKPLMGLRILWGLKRDGDQWSGGKILDPDNGKVYSSKIALEHEGKKLKVRGFIGVSLLGRTQHWVREE